MKLKNNFILKIEKVKNVQAMSAYSTKYEMTLVTGFIEEKMNEIPTGQNC